MNLAAAGLMTLSHTKSKEWMDWKVNSIAGRLLIKTSKPPNDFIAQGWNGFG